MLRPNKHLLFRTFASDCADPQKYGNSGPVICEAHFQDGAIKKTSKGKRLTREGLTREMLT